jgi:hypothetical protein
MMGGHGRMVDHDMVVRMTTDGNLLPRGYMMIAENLIVEGQNDAGHQPSFTNWVENKSVPDVT